MRLSERYDFESVVIDPERRGRVWSRNSRSATASLPRSPRSAKGPRHRDPERRPPREHAPHLRTRQRGCSTTSASSKWDYARLERKGGAQWKLRPVTHLAIDDRTPDHLADAFLYAHRECLHYLNEWRGTRPR